MSAVISSPGVGRAHTCGMVAAPVNVVDRHDKSRNVVVQLDRIEMPVAVWRANVVSF